MAMLDDASSDQDLTRYVNSIVKQTQQTKSPDFGLLTETCFHLANSVQKDMAWPTALAGPNRDLAVTALEAERESLMSTILTLIDDTSPDWERAVKEAVPGRYLLGMRRNGAYKARGV